MGRILAIDFGRKRSGIAVTDTLQMIANGLTTVPSLEIFTFLEQYFRNEQVDRVIVGNPLQLNNEPSEAQKYVNKFVELFCKRFPQIPLEKMDERYTSQLAMQTMISGGVKKKDRQNKSLVDTVSATIILQDYLKTQEIKKSRDKK